MHPRSGRVESLPYSLSRWTDLPAGKWDWFKRELRQGKMQAFDARTGTPDWWSLRPEDTLGLNFWTKDPSNLVRDASLLAGYRLQIHVTVTGWWEVERGAPGLSEAIGLLCATVATFGPDAVVWRFSPVPLVDDVALRFALVAEAAAGVGLRSVYVSFLQPNDLVPETRSTVERRDVLVRLAAEADRCGMQLLLCNDDQSIFTGEWNPPANLASGVCAAPAPWGAAVIEERCGCVAMVDPFSINETCRISCAYCYAADRTLSGKRRNTTHFFSVLR